MGNDRTDHYSSVASLVDVVVQGCRQCDSEEVFTDCVSCGLECCLDCLDQNEDGDYICIAHQ